jgi:serine/threonine protein kinase
MAMPERIGKYDIRSKLGEGATSIVYLGYDSFAQREVAVKVIHSPKCCATRSAASSTATCW